MTDPYPKPWHGVHGNLRDAKRFQKEADRLTLELEEATEALERRRKEFEKEHHYEIVVPSNSYPTFPWAIAISIAALLFVILYRTVK